MGYRFRWISVFCSAFLVTLEAVGQQPSATLLAPQQLDDLVAPIALYPDSLLSQALVASTYPLELVEAQEWLQQHPQWRGTKLLKEAKRQNWDPSVQAMVAFPGVLARLSQDAQWTTQLGNAFLTQQGDVMNAVQRMRARARNDGKLVSTPQQEVVTQTQNGQNAIEIVPTNPDVVYVPSYNPLYVWGPPDYGMYPPLWYPAPGIGFTFGAGIDLDAFFGGWGGWGWGGWGWTPGWFDNTVMLDHSFFHRYGFHQFNRGGWRGNSVWTHNPGHRLGVPYPNREMANRYRNSPQAGFRGQGNGFNRGFAADRGNSRESAPMPRFGSREFEQRNFGGRQSVFGGIHNGGMTRMESDHGFAGGGGFGGFHGGGGGFHGGGGGMRGGGGRR
jgi:hypothetical protein